LYGAGTVARWKKKDLPFKCDECDASFTQANGLRMHKQSHRWSEKKVSTTTTISNSTECSFCGLVLKNVCGKVFHEKRCKERPVEQVVDKFDFKCDLCGTVFERKCSLLMHQRKCDGKPNYQCLRCNTWFHTFTSRRLHQESCVSKVGCVCEKCGSTFTSVAGKVRHLSNCDGTLVSRKKVQLVPAGKGATCDRCNKSFLSAATLGMHQLSCTGEARFKCTQCGLGFFIRREMQEHRRGCTNRLTVQCEWCGKEFDKRMTFGIHKRYCMERPTEDKVIDKYSLKDVQVSSEEDLLSEEDESGGSEEDETYMMVDGDKVEVVKKFTYLGSLVTDDCSVGNEIMIRIGRAASAFKSLKKCLWERREIALPTKIHVFRASVLAILLYGSETWNLLYEDLRRLSGFYIRCLRSILRISPVKLRLTNQKFLTNKELCERVGLPTIEDIIADRRWRWAGHVLRMDTDRVPRRLMLGRLDKQVDLEFKKKPAMRWSDLIRQDMKQRLPTGDILRDAQDRKLWRSVASRRPLPTSKR